MAIFTTPTASFTGAGCSGATITAPAGATQISVSGASVNANSICTLSVRVVANIAGNLIDTIPAAAISSTQGVTNPLQGTATLAATGTVNLTITKTDGVASVVPGARHDLHDRRIERRAGRRHRAGCQRHAAGRHELHFVDLRGDRRLGMSRERQRTDRGQRDRSFTAAR